MLMFLLMRWLLEINNAYVGYPLEKPQFDSHIMFHGKYSLNAGILWQEQWGYPPL